LRPINALVLFFIFFLPVSGIADPFGGQDIVANRQLDNIEQQFSSSFKPGDAQKVFSSSSGQIHESSENPQARGSSNVPTRVHTLDVSGEILYYRYQEPGGPNIYGGTNPTVWNTGPMSGVNASYTYRPQARHILNNDVINAYTLQARYAQSQDLEYKGSGVQKDKRDMVDEFRGLLGKDFFLGADNRLTPYFGFGYRYLFDHGGGFTSTGAGPAYDRKSHYYYLPIGGDWTTALPHGWETDFNLEYGFLLYGLEKSYLSETDPRDGNNKGPETSGWELRGSVKFIKRGKFADFYIEPFVRYWSIEQSKSTLAYFNSDTPVEIVEPKNNTVEVGSKLGIEF
jgi:hypothetical protein